MGRYDESKHIRNEKGEYAQKPGSGPTPLSGRASMPYDDAAIGCEKTINLRPGIQNGEEEFFAPEPPEVGTNSDNTPHLDYENSGEESYVWQELRDADGNPAYDDASAMGLARSQGMSAIRKTVYRDDFDRPRVAYLAYRDAPGDLPCPAWMQSEADGMVERLSDEGIGSLDRAALIDENDRRMESTPYCNAFSNALRRNCFPKGLPGEAEKVIQDDIQDDLETLYHSGSSYSETYAYTRGYARHAAFLDACRGVARDV